MFKILDISISELRTVLGHETKSKYGTYYFRCPDCASRGEDTSGDNLVFNSTNGKLRCFACGEGQYTALKMINELRHERNYFGNPDKNKKTVEQKPKQTWFEINREELLQYQWEAQDELLEAGPVVEWLYEKHGINKQSIIDCGIGFDFDKNAVCFPIYSINHEQMLVGFEFRSIGEKKEIWRSKQAPACLAEVWGSRNNKNLIICEGFKDSYCLKQMLDLQDKSKDYYILSPANGVGDIIHHLDSIDFSKYKLCYLLVDNDSAGDKATREILEQYPFFIDKRSFLKKNGIEDVADYWKFKYMKGNAN